MDFVFPLHKNYWQRNKGIISGDFQEVSFPSNLKHQTFILIVKIFLMPSQNIINAQSIWKQMVTAPKTIRKKKKKKESLVFAPWILYIRMLNLMLQLQSF